MAEKNGKKEEKDIDMLKIHNETQKEWGKKYDETVEGIGRDIHEIRQDMNEIKEDVQRRLDEQDDKLKRDYKRFQKQRELNDKIQTRLETKKELDDARDRQIANIAERQNNVEQGVKDTLEKFQQEDKEYKKEVKSQIEKLGKDIKEGFVTAKKQRKDENDTLKKDTTKMVSMVVVILVPIIVALLTFALYKF